MRAIVCAFVLCLPLCLQVRPLQAQDDLPAPTESQQQAHDLLMRMANFLAGLDDFSVELTAGFDVVQDSGLKVEFIESRTIQLDRPSLLRIEEESGDGRGQLLLFDGTTITVFDGDEAVFAQAPQPETVDDAALYFVRELGMRLPLAPLLTTWAPMELEKRVLWIDQVEETGVFGVPARHLVATTANLDFQVWIAEGDQPLPLRMVLTYRDVGAPQYWAQFSNWDLSPEFDNDSFVWSPPDGASQIAFAVQVPPYQAEVANDQPAGAEGEQP